MASLKPFSTGREFMLQVDDAACDDGSENGFNKLSAGDDAKHLDSSLCSSKSASNLNC